MSREYVEKRNSAYYVADTRVSIASVVHHFRLGASPETILQKFPALGSLSVVYGAIAFYLENQNEVEASLTEDRQAWNEFSKNADPLPASAAEGMKSFDRQGENRFSGRQ
ncbi:MAG TPA: DUF433 domain-containing protein [Bryobacteraceae bacterium]|jgi:uncharacterized protein (DUF433 family)